jgi:hypothetical protein
MNRLDIIKEIASMILDQDPDPPLRYRLLRDVLCKPENDIEIIEVRKSLSASCWVMQLAEEQWEDGSWGRLHSMDTSLKQVIPTTEFGVERGLSLGLDANNYVLDKSIHYLEGILTGGVKPRDAEEKNDRWSTGVQLFAASTLAQMVPHHPLLDDIWSLWYEIALWTFRSGEYDPEAEIRAHRELTGASVKESYLVLNNKYSLRLLLSRVHDIHDELTSALIDWIWPRDDGIGYLDIPLSTIPRRNINFWFTSQELMSSIPSWVNYSGMMIEWLWSECRDDRLWNFGPITRRCATLPLSDNWRKKHARSYDWTVRTIILLSMYERSNL